MFDNVRYRLNKYEILILLTLMGIFIIYWSNYALKRYHDLDATFFDLGVILHNMWIVYNQPKDISVVIFGMPIVILLSPLIFLNNAATILIILQQIVVALGVLPLYMICKMYTHKKCLPIVIAISYLAYVPMIPALLFDVHPEMFFPTLFLFGYYFYVTGRYRRATLFYVLSILVRSLYPFFLVLYSILEIIFLKQRIYNIKFKYIVLILAISSTLLFSQLLFIMWVQPTLNLTVHLNTINTNSLFQGNSLNINSSKIPINFLRAYTIFFFSFPLSFTPIFYRSKWVFMLLPYFFAIGFSQFYSINFPFIYQYVSLLLPFIFLATLEVMCKAKRRRVLMILIVLGIALSTAFYQPSFSSYYKNNLPMLYPKIWKTNAVFEITPVSFQVFECLNQIAKLVPKNATVYIENNMPEFYSVKDPLLGNYNYNLDAIQLFGGGPVVNAKPDYAVFDFVFNPSANGWLFSKQNYPYNISPFELAKMLYQHDYKISFECDGIVLLKKNYSGPTHILYPFKEVIMPSSLFVINNLLRYNSLIKITNDSVNVAWFGPYIPLPPGKYTALFELMTTNNYANNTINLDVVTDYGQDVLNATTISGQMFKMDNIPQNFSVDFTLNNFTNLIEFRGLNCKWNGSLILIEIFLIQKTY